MTVGFCCGLVCDIFCLLCFVNKFSFLNRYIFTHTCIKGIAFPSSIERLEVNTQKKANFNPRRVKARHSPRECYV